MRLRDPSQRVHPRARTLWILSNVIWVVLLGVALLVCQWFDWFTVAWWGWALLAAYAVVEVLVAPFVRYAVHRWEVTDEAVYTQSGWLMIERRIAPMSRVQTVDLEQGPISKLLKLATVTATTASSAGALKIEGLDEQTAQELLDLLTTRAQAADDDAT